MHRGCLLIYVSANVNVCLHGCKSASAHVQVICVQCPGIRSSVCLREADSGLSHVRPSYMYSSEPGERLSEQVNNHI